MSSFFSTGGVLFVVLMSIALTIPSALALVWLYQRSVRAAMRRRSSAGPRDKPQVQTASAASPPTLELVEYEPNASTALGASTQAIVERTLRGPWRNALVYGVAGLGFGLVTAILFLIGGGSQILPLRLIVTALAFCWPVVLATNLLTAARFVAQVRNVAVYLCVLLALMGFNLRDAALLWLLAGGMPTIVLVAFMHRKVRTVGPLVFVFMTVGALGANLLLLPLENQGVQRTLGGASVATGLDVGWWIVLALVLGFALAGIVGWAALGWIRGRYVAKQVSDQSLSVDAIFAMFAVLNATDIGSSGALWGFLALGAFVVYRVLVSVGFNLLPDRRLGQHNRRLLLLRVFGSAQRSQRLMSQVGSRWRYVGSIELIAGTDLATTTLEPHELLEFVRGRIANRYIHSPQALAHQLAEMDLGVDFDGRFRINEFLCYDDMWRLTLSRLVAGSDAVLMDLRGFSPRNQGCVFELHALINLAQLRKVVLIVDVTTDLAFLRGVLQEGLARMAATSPNAGLATARVAVCRLTQDEGAGVRLVLGRLAEASATTLDTPAPKAASIDPASCSAAFAHVSPS